MNELSKIEPVDYLIIGHITQDITPNGLVIGGTASYAALTARAFGINVGIVTACRSDLDLEQLNGIQIIRKASEYTSTFENEYTPSGRIQHVHHVAETITLEDIPQVWRNAPIVHLGPVAREISPEIAGAFPNLLVGVTPQGWLREWDEQGKVSFCTWPNASEILGHANAGVLSIEDVRGDEAVIEEFASILPVLVVTEGASGSRVYWKGDIRSFRPPEEVEIDPVGAGDIFATAFFIRLHSTKDPWESTRFATLVAANSVTRKAIKGVPTPLEVKIFLTEILETKDL
jgi:sugar/nucleoside kinase (ribokinase family)